jgi:hypothetical protein
VSDQFAQLADDAAALSSHVGDLVYDALRAQTRGGVNADAAKETERQLARVGRSLAKAEQILRHLASQDVESPTA